MVERVLLVCRSVEAWRFFLFLPILTLACAGSPSDRLPGVLDLEKARLQLGRARAHQASRYAPEALRLAERELLEAEREVRREAIWLNPCADPTARRLMVRRAVASAEIAAWVAERNLSLARREARAFLWAAESAIESARRGAGSLRLPPAIRARLRQAQLSASEAAYLLRHGDPGRAAERARDAHALAGGAHGQAQALIARFARPANLETWRGWAVEAIAWTKRSGGAALVVDKKAHRAVLYEKGVARRRFEVNLGYNSLHQKLSAGDGATPEGRYRVVKKKGRGKTIYYKALLLNYPNGEDRRRFRAAKREGKLAPGQQAGGLIEIHGDGGRNYDWTTGCIALSNPDIDRLFDRLKVGSAVVIVGSTGEENLP